MSALGGGVYSIDLPECVDAEKPYFPVRPYDGLRVPFADEVFDIVFSSHVLEHIPHLPKIFE